MNPVSQPNLEATTRCATCPLSVDAGPCPSLPQCLAVPNLRAVNAPALPALDLDLLTVSGILDALPDGAYITDRDRLILFWNRAAEQITGWKREEVIGKHCRDNILVHVDKDGRALCGRETCPLHRSIVTERKSEYPLLIFARRADGSRVPVEASVAPLRDRSGTVVGGIEVFRDMSAAINDLNTARLIQRNTLQSPLPADPRVTFATHYVPHDLVGGDFFRIEPIDADRYAVLVADVTGHGVAAALYSMQIRSLWEDHRDEVGDPARFMAALNARLHTLARPNDYFATGVHAVVNAATGRVTYVRAGHEAPLLVRADGSVTKLNQRGAGLGLLPDTKYEAAEFDLQLGESLLLYTDGAVEINNADGLELGVDGLMKLVGAGGLNGGGRFLARLDEALLNFSNSIRLPDDLTLVCVQRPAAQSHA